MLVNHFKMKPEIKSYHLGCMACSAGAIGINLVQDLLKVSKGCLCAHISSTSSQWASGIIPE